MKVKVVSAFCLGGGKDVYEGTLLDLPEKDAKIKIHQGFVVALSEEEAAALEATAEDKETKGKGKGK